MKDQIRQLMHQTPFRPFRIHLSDGRSFPIPHPDYIFAGPSLGFEVIVDSGDGRIHYVSSNQITSIELQGVEEPA